MMKGSLTAALVMLGAGTTARADAIHDACVKKGVTNYDYDVCGGAYLKRAEAALNLAWRATFALTSGQTKADLLAEQRSWVVFKDKSCLFWANGDYGREGQVLSFPACRGEVIEQRTRALESIAKEIAPR